MDALIGFAGAFDFNDAGIEWVVQDGFYAVQAERSPVEVSQSLSVHFGMQAAQRILTSSIELKEFAN